LGLNRGGLGNTNPAYSITMMITFVVVISIGDTSPGPCSVFLFWKTKTKKPSIHRRDAGFP
jgi:hypothetical protein